MTSPSLKTELRYGIALGAVLCLWTMALFLTGFATRRIEIGQHGDEAALVITLIVVLLAIRRKVLAAGTPLTLIDRVTTGVLTSLIGQGVYLPFLGIYRRFINPEWLEYILELRRRELLASGISFDALERQISEMRLSTGDLEHTVTSLMVAVIVLGSLSGLVSLVLVRGWKREGTPQTQ